MATKGKYAHLTPNLPKLPVGEPERQAVIDAVRLEILEPPKADDPPLSLLEVNIEELGDITENIIGILKRATQGQRYASVFSLVYVEARLVKEKLKNALSDAQVLLDAYEGLMIEQMTAEGVRSQKLADGHNVTTFEEPYPQVEDKEAFRLWCVAPADRCMTCGGPQGEHFEAVEASNVLYGTDGHKFKAGGGLVNQLQLWPGTMASLVKEMLLSGEPEPPGVTTYSKTTVRVLKP